MGSGSHPGSVSQHGSLAKTLSGFGFLGRSLEGTWSRDAELRRLFAERAEAGEYVVRRMQWDEEERGALLPHRHRRRSSAQ